MKNENSILKTFSALMNPETIKSLVVIILSLIVMVIILKIILVITRKLSGRYFSAKTSTFIVRGVKYTGMVVIVMTFFQHIGIDITAILGAAGIAGVAIGFAAQTSISNIISGLFLISEKAFSVNDTIQIEGFTGTVLSIDLLSVKIRTLDNQYVRIPNEKLIKTEFTNITRYPIRRFTIDIRVSYNTDVSRVRDILLDIAKKNEYCLDKPEPLFVFNSFGSSAQEITFGVWFEQTEYLMLKNSIMLDIKKRFDEEDIEIPFTQITLSSKEEAKPQTVRERVAVKKQAPQKTSQKVGSKTSSLQSSAER